LGREARFWAGKRNFVPQGTSSVGSPRRPEPGEHDLPVKVVRQRERDRGRTSTSYGLRYASPSPSRGRSHDRLHSTGAGACQARVRHCSSLHASPQRDQEQTSRRETELRSEYSRSQVGIENATGGDEAIVKRPLRFCMRRRVVRSRTRKVVLPGRPLHEASPTGTKSPRTESPCTRCAVLPEAIPNLRNARFAPNFRHHPGIGGHRTR
jgi:hypothetical protein